jgi:hypothetical protein
MATVLDATEVSVERIPALVAELASEQSAISALQDALTVRLLSPKLMRRRIRSRATD